MPADQRHAIGAWGDSLRSDRATRRKVRYGVMALGLAIVMLGATIVAPPRPRLVWNTSASMPIGLYAVLAPPDLAAGDLVVAHVPGAWRSFAAARGYIPIGVPLVKRVAAAPGDRVCASGRAVTVEGRRVAIRLVFDGRGRVMPSWRGCATLRHGWILLLADAKASFDGRYFGPSMTTDVVGRARPLWTR